MLLLNYFHHFHYVPLMELFGQGVWMERREFMEFFRCVKSLKELRKSFNAFIYSVHPVISKPLGVQHC